MRRKSKRTFAMRLVGIGAFVVLLLGSLGWVYRSSFLTASLVVEQAMQGSIEHNQTITALFANEEVPIQAPTAGKPEFIGKEGQRFRRGDIIGVMKAEGVAPGQVTQRADVKVYAPDGGLLYYMTDGLESILTPKNLLSMDLSKVLVQNPEANRAEGMIQSGGSIGKIVNNLRPTVAVIQIPTSEEKLGKNLKFIIKGQTYTAKVVRLLDNPQGVVVQFNQYIEGTVNQRVQEIAWNLRPAVNGVIVPKSALWNKGEEQGVYVVVDGIIQFRQVKVLDEDDQKVCVEGLPHGITVIVNPHFGLDGLTINVKIPSES
jgi:putative membrane fusion protein